VLSSARTAELLNELREAYDVVLIDSAPVLAVTDTVPLLRYADATLFVGRFGVTSRDTAKRLSDFLARVPDVNVLGVVANELPRLDASSYGYGYGYGYGKQEGNDDQLGLVGRRTPRLGVGGRN
jgi:receptor protein-tyrosine kinase